MSEQLIITISGMRGIVGENLNSAVAAEYGCAFGTFLKRRFADSGGGLSVCIGRDTRPSGQMLQSAVMAGLSSVGIDVIDLGVITTPGVSIMVKQLGCSGGVVITASHNPIQYNGIKLLLDNGYNVDNDCRSSTVIDDLFLYLDLLCFLCLWLLPLQLLFHLFHHQCFQVEAMQSFEVGFCLD